NLQNVIGDMQSKINEPDKNIEFDDDKISFVRLNEYIDEVNDIIKKNNMKISDIKKSKKDLEANVFRFFSIDKRDIFKKYITEQEAIEDTIEDLKDSIFGFYEDINKKTEEIQVLEGKISNSKDTMDNINKTLKSLGMTDFELVSRDNKYTISRQSGSQQDPIFETLSEGEKNIITFIYFIYHAIGKHDSKLEDRIIVIDDPISSLSFDYVFEVAQMIKANFVKDKKLICSKLIILSHHLYFITELVLHTKIDKKKLACYRLSKSNNCTNSLAIIKNKEIGSEYDMLWKVLYKCKNDKGVIIENVLVANVMRQILERFISFTYCHTKRINEFFKKTTKENEYFVRWINRESHFDFINSEGVFTDKDKWFKCFEEFFYNNKHKDHYDKYMNKKDES
ncbi:MAG: AAA family ATPase, partial [Alphaproteobacteria bacterium]|nr:AAA family ATPase [Alphaproteobacteria bacterium]